MKRKQKMMVLMIFNLPSLPHVSEPAEHLSHYDLLLVERMPSAKFPSQALWTHAQMTGVQDETMSPLKGEERRT
jgi:hypothetical protein